MTPDWAIKAAKEIDDRFDIMPEDNVVSGERVIERIKECAEIILAAYHQYCVSQDEPELPFTIEEAVKFFQKLDACKSIGAKLVLIRQFIYRAKSAEYRVRVGEGEDRAAGRTLSTDSPGKTTVCNGEAATGLDSHDQDTTAEQKVNFCGSCGQPRIQFVTAVQSYGQCGECGKPLTLKSAEYRVSQDGKI